MVQGHWSDMVRPRAIEGTQMSDTKEPKAGTALVDAIVFDGDGLVPAVVQQHDTGQVLMLAWMNREAVEQTLAKGEAHFFSRSRQAQWRKGERSGQTQRVLEIRLDCDSDALLLSVDQTGVACHTGRLSCWFNTVQDGAIQVMMAADVDPAVLYQGK
jgi:phosphoribosyl-AMP cyclohydrolase